MGSRDRNASKAWRLAPSGACVWQRLDAGARGGTDEIRGELAIPKGAQHSNLPSTRRIPTEVAVVGKVAIASALDE